ncbi:MFS transporter [Streptomyces sp. NBC_01320]|uniref:MFS transporter n=1 Tax=Streptomyces sp. NBC_01320 TaxID=2903824 RepID=UPI002E11ED6A|nr:MHS family MFS transporter [Streptomyces sp. NBC_01320]
MTQNMADGTRDEESPAETQSRPAEPVVAARKRRVLVSSFLGGLIEWYDFNLYGMASAIVFAALFFPEGDAAAALIAAFATFAVGYIARPLGGVIAGHLGDRIGRKRVLVVTLIVMGLATTLIGVLPTYATIGVWAPILLIVVRLIQGVSVGGEWGGALLMTVEHAPAHRRGLWSAASQLGPAGGVVLATLVFRLVSGLPEEQFLSWGWRIPFLLSLVLVAIATWIRAGTDETPVFEKVKPAVQRGRIPLMQVLTRDRRPLGLVVLLTLSISITGTVVLVFTLSYAIGAGFSSSTALTALLIASLVNPVTTLIGAALSDRFGRRPVYVVGMVLMLATAFLLFPLVDSGSPALLLVAFILGYGCLGLAVGAHGVLIAELFPSNARYTGVSLGYQFTSSVAGLGPLIASALMAWGGGKTTYITLFLVVIYLISAAVAIFAVPETYRSDITRYRE